MFKKMQAPQFPPRHWAIYGDAGSGKSHFASQMKGPLLPIDADGRFTEQLKHALGDVYQLSSSNDPTEYHRDNTDSDRIIALLRQNLPGSGVRTISVDSLTAILRPIINQGLVDAETAKNKVSVWRDKALAMSRMQDAVTSSGCDSLWIWHTHESRDKNADLIERASIPQTELVRLRRSLNMILRIDVAANGQRSVLVEWARNGKSGIRLTDDAGGWRGMPERIEAAVYAEGVKSDGTPSGFANPTDAIAWGNEQGCFRDARHAASAYEKCKRAAQPKTATDMWAAWIADVQQRVAAKAAGQPVEDTESEAVPA
jgi:hypothetical protein